MAIPVLKLNLVPPPSYWRRKHGMVGWLLLVTGSLSLLGALGLTGAAYRQARTAGLQAGSLAQQTQDAARRERDIQNRLRQIDVEKELPRWKLAERILAERSLPWSRLTAELERSLVQDVRLKSLLRVRDSKQQVTVRLKAEAKTREAEVGFVEALQKNECFSQVILEREAERQGGGLEFEITLPVAPNPPAYTPLPKATRANAPKAAHAVPVQTKVPALQPAPSTGPKPAVNAPQMNANPPLTPREPNLRKAATRRQREEPS